jgi:hypothetical protein
MALTDQVRAYDTAAVLNALSALARPVALHSKKHSRFRIWLEEHGIGRDIFTSDTDAVRLIDRNDFASAIEFTATKP